MSQEVSHDALGLQAGIYFAQLLCLLPQFFLSVAVAQGSSLSDYGGNTHRGGGVGGQQWSYLEGTV